ncbi:MAG: hypothetical protein HDQ88_10685 [Clostridia bacterium]|nr:hypothetical protein [Clostridia bacterium]
MKKKRGESTFFKRLKTDFEFRTYITSTVSFFVTFLFAVYNVFLGIAYKTVWNIGIAVYYLLLVGVRAFVGYKEIKLKKSQLEEIVKDERRKNVYIAQSVMFFIIDLALIGPITLMVLQRKSVDYSKIPAIAIAAYTVFKIATSSVSYAKTRNAEHLSVKMLKNVNFIDALVSVLTLQYTLIMTFDSKGITGSMLTLCAITSFVIWVFLIAVSVTNLIRAVKTKRAL